MITLIPALDVMKAMTDNNITSVASHDRRKAFHHSIDLKSLCDFDVLLDGVLYEKIGSRLEEEHKKFFENNCRIDLSTVGVQDYSGNVRKSISWISLSEAKSRRVIILTSNPEDYVAITSNDIKAIRPEDFIEKVKRAKEWHSSRKFSDLIDALTAIFFI